MQALLAIEARCTQLKAELAQYAESDPDRFTKISEHLPEPAVRAA